MTNLYLNNRNLPGVSRRLSGNDLAQVALKVAHGDAEEAMVFAAQAYALEAGESLELYGNFYLTHGRDCTLAKVAELQA